MSTQKDAKSPRVMAFGSDSDSDSANVIAAPRDAERHLRLSQEFNRSWMDATPDCVKVMDVERRLLHMNTPGLCAMEIDDFDSVCGQQWEAIWPADAQSDIKRSVSRAVAGEVSSFQAFCPTAKGTPKWWEVTVSPIRDAEGGPVVRLLVVSRDITHRRQVEDRLHASEAQFRAIFEQSAVGMAQVSASTGRMVRVNAKYCELTGYSAGELAGMTPAQLTIEKDRDDDVKAQVAMLNGEIATYDAEKRYVRKDGKIIWVHVNATMLFDADGRPERTIAVVHDVTDRKQAEVTLRESEDLFRSLVTATTQIVWTSGADGLVVKDSPTWRAFTGQTVEQWLGWGWADVIHPDDQEATVASWKLAHATTAPVMAEYRLRRHDGEYHWMSVNVVPVMDAAGVLRAWVGTNTDITEQRRAEKARRESEERLRAATALVSDLIWTNNADGLMEGEQSGWGDFTGQSREQYQGYGWSTVIHPDDAQPTLAAWNSAVAEKRTFVFEHRVRRHDGQWRLCSVRAMPIFRGNGSIREWVGVHTDITEQRRDEEKLKRLAVELSEASLRKDEFLATLAHELRNPLAPIRNGLQLIKLAGGQNETMEQARSMMERQLTQMVRLVDDLMDVSRISQGKLELRRERIPLASVLHSAVESSRSLIEKMDHELSVTLPAQPLYVDADITRLAQVFLNLLNNAAKYSDRGAHIKVNVERQGSDAVVTVKDTGIGIAPDHLPRLFDMFMQVDRSLEKSQGGLGIGLTLVKRLVELHGGGIEATSEGPGKGSEFVVRLPILSDASQPQAPDFETEPVASKSSLRILVVDDNRDAANSMSELLEIMGNDTRTAYEGQQGVDMAEEYRPDVILFDIGMPKLNGYDACRLIRQQPWGKGVMLIAVTGWGQDRDRSRTQEAGFDHHLVKPVDPQALLKMLAGLDIGHETTNHA